MIDHRGSTVAVEEWRDSKTPNHPCRIGGVQRCWPHDSVLQKFCCVPPDSEAIKTRATRDWRAVLREHFALTPLQKRALEVLPKETVQQVAQAISQAIRTHSGFVVRAIAAPEAGPPLEQPSGRTPSTADSDATRLAAWKKPDSIQCSKTDVTYECRVKAGVVC